VYLGYLPRRTHERRATIQAAAELPYTLIFLETPHRLLAALADLQAVLGERRVAVARELTKLHEEIFRGELGAALAHFQANPPRGEFTLVVSGHTGAPQKWEVETVRQAALIRLKKGTAPSRLAAELAGEAGWPRRAVYQLILDLTKEL
jgi:16S rRNA (cytidine1402-2'-O)-methyltransferase